MTRKEFIDTIHAARAGEAIVYFAGPSLLYAKAARAALAAYHLGYVELSQKRLTGPFPGRAGEFAYIATKRHDITPPAVARRSEMFVEDLLAKENLEL